MAASRVPGAASRGASIPSTAGARVALGRRAALLRLHEGVKARLYRDTAGHWTIGVGRNLDATGLRPDEITLLLANDMEAAEQELDALCPWARTLDEVRYAVLAELMFNLGRTKLARFAPTLALVQRGAYDAAAARLLRTKWARDVKATRAGRLTTMLRTGQWPEEVR